MTGVGFIDCVHCCSSYFTTLVRYIILLDQGLFFFENYKIHIQRNQQCVASNYCFRKTPRPEKTPEKHMAFEFLTAGINKFYKYCFFSLHSENN